VSGLNILIITYDWPPRNSIAVHRPYAWAKHWSCSDCNVTVLTAEKCLYDSPLDLVLPELDGVKVVEVPYRSSFNGRKTTSTKFVRSIIIDLLKKQVGFFRKALRLSLDIRDAWAKKAEKVALDLHEKKKFDVVVSSYGPRACHFIGRTLKESDSSIFWVADYRDMWSIRHNADLQGGRKHREQRLERKTLKRADLLTTVSAPLVSQLKAFLEKDVNLVFNGYDLDLSEVKGRIGLQKKALRKNKLLKIAYTGMIYPGWQDPAPLFQAVGELIEEGKITPSQVRIDFFGKRQPQIQAIVHHYDAGEYVKIHGHVTRETALEEQRKADLLLLMESGNEAAKGVLTGKVFEYMVSGKPILSLGSQKNSAIGQLIEETGIGIVCEQDIEKIKKCLQGLISGSEMNEFCPNFEKIKLYNRGAQSQDFLRLIKSRIY